MDDMPRKKMDADLKKDIDKINNNLDTLAVVVRGMLEAGHCDDPKQRLKEMFYKPQKEATPPEPQAGVYQVVEEPKDALFEGIKYLIKVAREKGLTATYIVDPQPYATITFRLSGHFYAGRGLQALTAQRVITEHDAVAVHNYMSIVEMLIYDLEKERDKITHNAIIEKHMREQQ